MFSYTITKNADKNAFDRTCALIESKVKDIKKERILEDVDGTQIQIYNTPTGKIKVYNDYYVDAVYVDSTVNIDHILQEICLQKGYFTNRVPITTLDGPMEKQIRALKEFLGLRPDQSFQDLDVDIDEDEE